MIVLGEFLVIMGIVALTTISAFVTAIFLVAVNVFLWNRGFFDD